MAACLMVPDGLYFYVLRFTLYALRFTLYSKIVFVLVLVLVARGVVYCIY